MKLTSLKKYLVLLLLGMLILSIYYLKIISAVPIFSVFLIQFFYHFFYTEQPRRFVFIAIAGITLSFIHISYPLEIPISIFAALCILECIRVILMAILNYPDTIQDLKALTEELEKRVEDRTAELKETNLQLQKANERLLELDKMKSAFVSQASHDLRTPLTAIKGSLDNLSLGIAGELNEKQAKILSRASRSVDRLNILVNDILDLSRIESGRVVLNKTDVSLRAIVQNIIQENKPAAQLKQITIEKNEIDDPLTIHADPGKIERVVGELVSNAIKYTPEHGSIRIHLERSDTQAIVSVHDTGVGMEPEECDKIWERFYRTNSTKHMAKGSGLGLSIAKELIEMHGGSIRVTSRLNEGSTFILTLPVH